MRKYATIALKPGMELGEDVHTHQNELLIPARTVLTEAHIKKMSNYSIMCATIMEPADYATTHFEKVRLSDGFRTFEFVYQECLSSYKSLMMGYILNGSPFTLERLMELYHSIIARVPNGDTLLDYLYNMLPSEDDLTHAHCFNSALIAGVFAKWLNLSSEDTQLLIQCGFLYDIGKLKLPDELIWKTDKLTEAEFNHIKAHTILGFRLLEPLKLDKHITNAALMHHERYDGSGYPSALHGDKIDRFAKYIAIIDSYEAMTSARIYRGTMHQFKMIANFEKAGFITYDETLLRPILSHIASTQMGRKVRLNDDRVADIILINQKYLSRPMLRTEDGYLIDLASEPSLEIEAIF
ncbi:MAG: HD domain-containing protein [Lachnospiraceae bacterium]|nr:HD domain-containing protein [Lachnospiraceae bacterium]